MKRTKIHIKPEELRIGNYVMISDRYVDFYYPIVGVKQTSVYIASGRTAYAVPLRQIGAVLLTRDILTVWCGFAVDEDAAKLKKGKIKVILEDRGTATVHFGRLRHRICCLHELQNIYYFVTGEELAVTPDRHIVEKAPRPVRDFDEEMRKSIEKYNEIRRMRGEE